MPSNTAARDDGATDTVRLIGINTPERDECYASEATDALSQLVLGRRVGLTVDATDRDIYNRLLRYIWVGDTHVNEQLVAGGYAIARRYPPDTGYADTFDTAQATARAGSVGMWAPDACGPGANRYADWYESQPVVRESLIRASEVLIRGQARSPSSGTLAEDQAAANEFIA